MAEQPQEKPQQASQPIQTETKTVQAYAPQQPVVIKQGGGKALGIGALVLSLMPWVPVVCCLYKAKTALIIWIPRLTIR